MVLSTLANVLTQWLPVTSQVPRGDALGVRDRFAKLYIKKNQLN